MRTTLNIEDELLAKAAALTGIRGKRRLWCGWGWRL